MDLNHVGKLMRTLYWKTIERDEHLATASAMNPLYKGQLFTHIYGGSNGLGEDFEDGSLML